MKLVVIFAALDSSHRTFHCSLEATSTIIYQINKWHCVFIQVEEELWEEEFIERCFQEMLEEEEQWEWFIPSRDLPLQGVTQLQDQISLLAIDNIYEEEDFNIDVAVSSRCLCNP